MPGENGEEGVEDGQKIGRIPISLLQSCQREQIYDIETWMLLHVIVKLQSLLFCVSLGPFRLKNDRRSEIL